MILLHLGLVLNIPVKIADLTTLWIERCGLLVNHCDKDNLLTKDKIPVPKVSIIQRFHCNNIMVIPNHTAKLISHPNY